MLAVGYSVCSTSVLYSTTWHLQLFKAYALLQLCKELLQTLVSCFIPHFMSLSTTGLILLSHFPSPSNEKKGYWVGFADNPGDRLTWRILTEHTQKIIICSGIQNALRTTTNQRLASPSGEGTTLPFSIPYPQQSKNSLPLDPFDESTPNFEQFLNSQSGEDEDNPIHMDNIDIPNLLGRSFLLPPEDNGERHMAKIIDIDDHGQPLEDIKFKLKINKDQAEEIMSYNQLMDHPEGNRC